MGNKSKVVITTIRYYKLVLSSGFSISLIDCFYLLLIARNIIYFDAFYRDSFTFGFDNNNSCILVYKNYVLYFTTNTCNEIDKNVIGYIKTIANINYWFIERCFGQIMP